MWLKWPSHITISNLSGLWNNFNNKRTDVEALQSSVFHIDFDLLTWQVYGCKLLKPSPQLQQQLWERDTPSRNKNLPTAAVGPLARKWFTSHTISVVALFLTVLRVCLSHSLHFPVGSSSCCWALMDGVCVHMLVIGQSSRAQALGCVYERSLHWFHDKTRCSLTRLRASLIPLSCPYQV